MGQISLYVDDAVKSKLNVAAHLKNCSVSKYVAEIVSERLFEYDAEESRKKELLRKLRGSIKDPTFVVPEDIPFDTNIPRRYDLM